MARTRKPTSPQPLDESLPARIDAALAVIGAGVAKRRGRPAPEPELEEDPELIMQRRMAYWDDLMMGIPNDLIRCALFTAKECDRNRMMDDEIIASHKGTIVTYTGWQLGQSHLDVYEGIMHCLRRKDYGTIANFNSHELLVLLNRDVSGARYSWLKRKINDIAACLIKIEKDKEKGFFGSLIDGGKYNNKTGNFSVRVNEDLIYLFDQGFTKINWSQRNALTGKPLACWLQLYYASHDRPHSVGVDFIHSQCGSEAKELKDFKKRLIVALNNLMEVGAIAAWSIDKDGAVTVEKRRGRPKKAA